MIKCNNISKFLPPRPPFEKLGGIVDLSRSMLSMMSKGQGQSTRYLEYQRERKKELLGQEPTLVPPGVGWVRVKKYPQVLYFSSLLLVQIYP